MENYEILQLAINNFHPGLKMGLGAEFGLVHSLLSTIASCESAKKVKLIETMQNLWKGKTTHISGCKRENVQQVAALVFGIRSAENSTLLQHLAHCSFEDIYLYYCYIEWLAKEPGRFRERFLEEQKLRKRQKTEAEERQKREAEEARLNAMSREELIKHEIFTGKDMYYYGIIENDQSETLIIARLLKEYWIQENKWDRKKLKEKQATRIAKIKELLGET